MVVAAAMSPTYMGYVGSTKDALLVMQAVLNGQLMAVPRRPHDRERTRLISSGNVFVFIEERSGIRRWTDGVAWSPSRILGRFLVYRELDRSALSSKEARGGGASDRYSKRGRKSGDINLLPVDVGAPGSSQHVGSFSSASSSGSTHSMTLTATAAAGTVPEAQMNAGVSVPSNRSLVGSLVASYAFKEYGLIKKTMSLTVNRLDPQTQQPVVETIHLVSYYAAEDILSGKFDRPVDTPTLKDIQLSNELWTAVKETSLGGKVPADEEAFYFMDTANPMMASLGFPPSNVQNMSNPHSSSAQLQQENVPVSEPIPQHTYQSVGIPYGGSFGYSLAHSHHQFLFPQIPDGQSQHHNVAHALQHPQIHNPSFPLPPQLPRDSVSSDSGSSHQPPHTQSHDQQHQQHVQQSQGQPFMGDLNLSLYGSQSRFPPAPSYSNVQNLVVPVSFNPSNHESTHPIPRGGSPDSPTKVKSELTPSGMNIHQGHGSSGLSSSPPSDNNYNVSTVGISGYPIGSSLNQYPRMNTMDSSITHQHLVNPLHNTGSSDPMVMVSPHVMNPGSHVSSGNVVQPSHAGMVNHHGNVNANHGGNGNFIGQAGTGKWLNNYEDSARQQHHHQQHFHHEQEQQQQQHQHQQEQQHQQQHQQQGYASGLPAGSASGQVGAQLH